MIKVLIFSDVYHDSFNGKYTFQYLNNKISSKQSAMEEATRFAFQMTVLRSVSDKMIIKSFILPYAKMQNLNNIFIICKGMFSEGFQQSAFKKSQGYVLFNSLANKRTLSSMAYVRSGI